MKWALGSRASMSITLQEGGGVVFWWMLIGTPSAKRYTKASKEKTGGEFMMSAVGVKKPLEAQKEKALWKMKAAKDAGEEYYDPEREDNILVINQARLAPWEEHLKDSIVALDKAQKCDENSC